MQPVKNVKAGLDENKLRIHNTDHHCPHYNKNWFVGRTKDLYLK
jgi:hypothetical protein